MAKEKSNTTAEAEAVPKKEKKQKQPTRAGAVFGSILLFLLTLLFGICFLCSSVLNSVLPQKTLSAAIVKMDLSQMQLSDHGKEQPIGKCLYDWYFWDAPNLTEEYAEKLVTMPECSQFLCDYLDDLSTYMTGDNSELPQLQPDDVADLLQEELGSKLTKETHVVFAEADRKSLNWTMGDDLNSWNSMLQHTIGSGFGKFLTRQLCNLSGMIAFGVLTVACFVLWLVLAVKKHWHKGRMFTAYGLAVAIPGLLVLAASGVTLLLVVPHTRCTDLLQGRAADTAETSRSGNADSGGIWRTLYGDRHLHQRGSQVQKEKGCCRQCTCPRCSRTGSTCSAGSGQCTG